ncbi:tail fiber domain-containing protein, partial [Pseudomonas syringae]
MPWSRNGTVAVTQNSTTVTGTGTTFASTSRLGDAFNGPDGRRYEVVNIVSETVLSILPAYAGASASGAAYSIEPVQGYPKALTDSFNSVNLLWGSRLAALGTTGNYEILPVLKGGTGSNSADGAVSSLGFMAGTMYPKFGGAGFAASVGGYNLQGG